MQAILELEATVSSKGQITLPAAMRARLGLVEGSKVKFFCGDKEAVLKPELPVSHYRGILRHLGNPAGSSISSTRPTPITLRQPLKKRHC